MSVIRSAGMCPIRVLFQVNLLILICCVLKLDVKCLFLILITFLFSGHAGRMAGV